MATDGCYTKKDNFYIDTLALREPIRNISRPFEEGHALKQ